MRGLPRAFDADAQSLIVFAPHPDDDVIGCGALIAYAARRIPVRVVYVTDGSASHVGSVTYPPRRLRDVREREAVRAVRRLGRGVRQRFLRWPDGAVPLPDGANAAALIARLQAEIPAGEGCAVAYPWRRDPHADHQAVAALVDVALRERPRALRIEYAVWLGILGDDDARPRPGEGRPVDVPCRRWVPAKSAALNEHRSQLGQVVFDAAEAFQLPAALVERARAPFERFIVGGARA
jgi:LmbE family N-acetylglucosaminyl deacetylase